MWEIVTLTKIEELLQAAQEKEKEGKLIAAKNLYLDAASLALEKSKNSILKVKVKYENIAKKFVKEAKLVQKKIDAKKALPAPPGSIDGQPDTHPKPAEKSADEPKKIDIFENYIITDKSETIKIPLGLSSETNSIEYWEVGKEMNGFLLLTGGSGSGKTEGIKGLVLELSERGYPCLILDLHGDIEADIPTISLDYKGEFGVNPLALVNFSEGEGGPIPKINELLDQFNKGIKSGLSDVMYNTLRNILIKLYQQFDIHQNISTSWRNPPPNYGDFLLVLKTLLDTVDGKERPTINAIIARLNPILEHPAFRSNNVIDYSQLTKYPLRIILKSLTSLSLQFIAADTIMSQLFIYLKSLSHYEGETDDKKFRAFLVIDEVKILMGYRGKPNDSRHILNILATEARKFGLGLILASQVATHFGQDIQANSAVQIVLKPMNAEQAKINAKNLEINAKALMNLTLPGEGFLRSSRDSDTKHFRLISYEDRPYIDFQL